MKKEIAAILNYDYKGPYYHARMSKEKRAAQFMPFAALTGYDEAIAEKGRTVERKRELSEEEKEKLSMKISYLLEHKKEKIPARFIYFVPDRKKEGGSYEEKEGVLSDYDPEKRTLRISPDFTLKIADILAIESKAFPFFPFDR